MKNKRIIMFFGLHLIWASFLMTSFAQGEYSTTWKDGITVAWMTEFSKPWPKHIKGYSVLGKKPNTQHHVFADAIEKIYFGYDFELDENDEKDTFKVSIKPLSIRPRNKHIDTSNFAFRDLPNYPGPLLVKDGETIVLDILENPETKEKISHLIRLTRNKSRPVFSDLHRAKDFTVDEVNLKISDYEIFVDEKKVYTSSSGTSGGNVGFYIPGRGRFILSPFLRDGYKFQKIGQIVNNKFTFTYAGKKYEIVAKSAILGEGGKWHAWVLFEPLYKPDPEVSNGSEVLTQSGYIGGFFNKRN